MAEDNIVSTKGEILKSLEGQQLKQHIVHDAQLRPQFIFEAPVSANDGDPCLVTELVYIDPTESIVIKKQERQYRWKASWDTLFVFDKATSYDPDGDGKI